MDLNYFLVIYSDIKKITNANINKLYANANFSITFLASSLLLS